VITNIPSLNQFAAVKIRLEETTRGFFPNRFSPKDWKLNRYYPPDQ